MVWLIRFALLALILVCAVSLLGLVLPDAKASDRRHRQYMGMVVAVCAVVCILFQALVPTEFKAVGEGNEVTETHSLATLKTGTHLSGKASLFFGYLNEKEDYVLMVKRDDGGYRRRCYSADSVVVYEDADADRGVIAFWDGSSKGTAQSFALSKEFDNPLRIIRVDLSHGSLAS